METILYWIISAFAGKLDPTVYAAVFAVFWALSEALSLIPSVKANGIFQLVFNILKRMKR